MRHPTPSLVLFLLGIAFLIFSTKSFAQIWNTSNNVYRDSFELTLEEFNTQFAAPNNIPLAQFSNWVNENGKIWVSYEVPPPKKKKKKVELNLPFILHPLTPAPPSSTSISGIDFDTDGSLNGFYHIPPDPYGAAGTTHVGHVVNCSISFNTKAGGSTSGFPQSLSSFFSSLNPITDTFDPKILWDQYENRFVVVTLERTTSPTDTSRVLLAVSETNDPTGNWFFQAIDAEQVIGGNDCWFDYPGLGIDDEAIYITGNYFEFAGNAYCGASKLIIVDKGVSGGIYDGTTSSNEDPSTNPDFSIYQPISAGGTNNNTTLQPAHMYGTLSPTEGMYFMSYSGLSGGGNEFIQILNLQNPLGSTSNTGSYLSIGNVDNLGGTFGDIPQNGNPEDIDSGDRRALNCVWRNDQLWGTFSVLPPSGSNNGQVCSFYTIVNTSSSYTLDGSGEAGGEDINTAAQTWNSSISVNNSGIGLIAFSACNSSMFAGSYAANIDGSSGAIGATQTLQTGSDDYLRTFGAGTNRWGDYSNTCVDPSDGSFWVTNQAAISNGSPSSGSGEDGRWQAFINQISTVALPVELLSFSVRPMDRGAQLYWSTASEIDNYGFYIEKKQGDQFEVVGFVEGNNGEQIQNYEWNINYLPSGIHVFRLRQVDYDGKESFSDLVSISIRGEDAFEVTQVSPNPFKENIKLEINISQSQRLLIQVHDYKGLLHYEQELPAQSELGIHSINIPLSQLREGSYILSIVGEQKVHHSPLIKS